MWSATKDVIEIAAAAIVVNKIVASNLLERLDAMLTKSDLTLKEGDKQLNRRRAG